jgi:Zn-dependent metalloprotease
LKKRVALAAGVAAAAVTGSLALTVSHISAATTPAGLEAATQQGPPGSSGDRPGTSNGDAVPPAEAAKRATAAAAALVAKSPKSFFKGAHDKLVTHSVVHQAGLEYVSYERMYNGVPVQGGDAVVVTDSNGKVLSNYSAQEQVLTVGTKAKIPGKTAVQVARKQLVKVESTSDAKLTVVAEGPGVLTYEVVVTGQKRVKGHLAPSRLHVFVDATKGTVLTGLTRDDVVDAAGKGYYYGNVTLSTKSSGGQFTMADPTRSGLQCGGQNGSVFTNSSDNWGTGAATDAVTGCVDAMYAVSQEWNMLRDWLGRNGIDGNGRGFPIRVGLNDVNAFWDGTHTEFGHSSDNRRLLTVIDVVGHEFGHAINQFTPGGSSNGNEAGGMNESTGDIFGTLTEFYANNAGDKGDYEIGELANLVGQGPIRYMYDPSKAGDPNCYSSRIPSTEVHSAAGPQNHWFYLLAEGSRPTNGQPSSPTCNNSTVAGIGIQKAGKIYMATLMRKTSGWTYVKARAASVAAAAQLFGNGTECAATKAAWDAVSVPAGNGEPTCTGTTPSPSPTRTTPPTASPSPTATTGPSPTVSPTVSPTGNPSPTPTGGPTPSGDCKDGYGSHDSGAIADGATAYTDSFKAGSGRQTGCLSGPDNTDFDLYLEKNVAGFWRTVAKSTGDDSHELITYVGTAGTYRHRVVSYSGAGNAVLGWNAPAPR